MHNEIKCNQLFKHDPKFNQRQIRRLWSVFADTYNVEAGELGLGRTKFTVPTFLAHLAAGRSPPSQHECLSIENGSVFIQTESRAFSPVGGNVVPPAAPLNPSRDAGLASIFAAPVPLESWLPTAREPNTPDISICASGSGTHRPAAVVKQDSAAGSGPPSFI